MIVGRVYEFLNLSYKYFPKSLFILFLTCYSLFFNLDCNNYDKYDQFCSIPMPIEQISMLHINIFLIHFLIFILHKQFYELGEPLELLLKSKFKEHMFILSLKVQLICSLYLLKMPFYIIKLFLTCIMNDGHNYNYIEFYYKSSICKNDFWELTIIPKNIFFLLFFSGCILAICSVIYLISNIIFLCKNFMKFYKI